jgi:pyridoxine 4-dehydrogenase
MVEQIDLAGRFALSGTAMTLNRVGYGAMQLAGQDGNKLVWGLPAISMERSRFCARPSRVG